MVMVALSRRGYCRTFSVRMACRPAMTMIRLTTMASTGRRTKMSVSCMSPVLRSRRQRRRQVDLVVDHHRRAVAQLEGPLGDHLLPGGQAFLDGHEVTARLSHAYELLAGHLGGPAVGTFHQVAL